MNPENEKTIVDEELLENAAPEEHVVPESENLKSEELNEGADAGAISLDELQAVLEQKEDRYLRLYAEFENYKRRSQREKLQLMETAGGKTMRALLPVLDDLDRAAKQAEQDEDTAKVWAAGVGLIVKKLYQALESQGLQPMQSDAEAFDADLHEAITEIPHPEMAGKVVDTVEKGYTLNGKIIRHAKVVVGK